MKILVTGASGHLGANLVRRLLKDGQLVRVLLRSESNNEAVQNLDVEKYYGDLRDENAILEATQGCNHVYHCGARISTQNGNSRFLKRIYDCNVMGTIHVLRAARKYSVSRVVVTSSDSAVGYDPPNTADENSPVYPFFPFFPYGTTKVCVEHECLKAFADGLDVVIATCCAIVGPNDFKPSRVGQTLLDFANGKLPAYIPGDFEFLSINDAVTGHLLAMEKGRAGQKYIFSTEVLTVEQLMDIFEKLTGRKRPRLRLSPSVMGQIAKVGDFVYPCVFPNSSRRFTSTAVRLLQMNRRVDISKAKNELGYEPTSVANAISDAYKCFVKRGLIQ